MVKFITECDGTNEIEIHSEHNWATIQTPCARGGFYYREPESLALYILSVKVDELNEKLDMLQTRLDMQIENIESDMEDVKDILVDVIEGRKSAVPKLHKKTKLNLDPE